MDLRLPVFCTSCFLNLSRRPVGVISRRSRLYCNWILLNTCVSRFVRLYYLNSFFASTQNGKYLTPCWHPGSSFVLLWRWKLECSNIKDSRWTQWQISHVIVEPAINLTEFGLQLDGIWISSNHIVKDCHFNQFLNSIDAWGCVGYYLI